MKGKRHEKTGKRWKQIKKRVILASKVAPPSGRKQKNTLEKANWFLTKLSSNLRLNKNFVKSGVGEKLELLGKYNKSWSKLGKKVGAVVPPRPFEKSPV